MKTYSDLQAIDHQVHVQVTLEPIGTPDTCIIVGPHRGGGLLFQPVDFTVSVPLLTPFIIQIELANKIYSDQQETAVRISRLCIDDVDILPRYLHLAQYVNDHAWKDPTDYLGFNGKWTLTIDQPFYQWLHQHSGQGWLLG